MDALFVCTHNSGRSVAAKTIFNHRAATLGLNLVAESAGTQPAKHINPNIAKTLAEFRIDTSQETPKRLTDEMLAPKPKLITMGCDIDDETCPALNPDDTEDWNLPDPAHMHKNEITPLLHEIARRVNTLIQSITTTAS